MPETTYYCDDTNDGSNSSQDYTWDNPSWPNPWLDAYCVGCWWPGDGSWKYQQSYTAFNLASPYAGDAIPVGASITSAEFSMRINAGGNAYSTTRYGYAARHDWLPSLDNSEWCNRAAMLALRDGGDGLFASIELSPSLASATRHVWPAGAKMLDDITACIGASLPLVLWDAHHMNGVTPTGIDHAWWSSANESVQTYRPRLVVQWSAGDGGGTQFRRAPGVLRLGSRGVRE